MGELPSPTAFRVMSFGFGSVISRSEWDELRKLTQTLFHVEQFHSIFSLNPLPSRFNISPSSIFLVFAVFPAFSLPLVDSLQNGAFVLLSLPGVF